VDDPQVVVIGAGAGGPVVAKELAERGVKVLVLEAGPWLDPDEDFTRLEDDMSALGDGRLRWGPADRSRDPWTRVREGAGLILQTAGVGGSTLHYNGISPRAYVPSVDGKWPMAYADLVPYFERVEAFLPVIQVRDLATKDALFAAGCEGIGLPRNDSRDVAEPSWKPCYNAILPVAEMAAASSLRWPEVDGCTMCGHCLQGCRHPAGAPLERKAKRATNVSYVPAAVASGCCEIVPNAFATRVLFQEGGDGARHARARGVRWRDTGTGDELEVEAAVVVLAGGAIESPRLWLNSGLPNSHDAVGRRLTTHFQDLVTGFFDREVHPNVGQVTMARADFPGSGTVFAQGYGPQAYSIAVCGAGVGTWDESTGDEPWDIAGKGWGEDAVRRIRQYHRSLSCIISTDDEAVPENRVTVAEDWEPDEHGSVPRVIYTPTAASRDRQDHLARKGAEILRAAGAREVHRTRFTSALLTHIMGTMRMGEDPATSVVDDGGEAHEVARLFVADTSVLPGVGGANPTLSAQALAVRTADEIARRYLS
jgi:choline dehydrogenase-like flavoprotein